MRVHHVKSARKDYPNVGIKKGEPYYWWKFNFGPMVRSKTYPRRSQLTRSSFLSQLYDIQDRSFTLEGLEGEIQEVISDLENLRDEAQESLDNMPEHLQETSSSGETLQERINTLDEYISNLENIDLDWMEDDELTEEEKQEKFDATIDEINDADPGIG